MRIVIAIFLTLFLETSLYAKTTQMTCPHSFQGNYSGGSVLLKYKENEETPDKAFVLGNDKWIEICSDVTPHGEVKVNNLVVSCSIYFPNWMDQRRKDFIWNFSEKVLYVQTLSRRLNPNTGEKEWQWSQSVGELFSKNWVVNKFWESEGIEYLKRKCF